nr:biotin/lipoyl-containing protein [Paenibacillus larvae]
MMEFKLPDVGEGIHEGEIGKWLIKEGEQVNCDQPIVEVMTDKVNAELTAPAKGVVRRLMFAEGDKVEVGQVLFLLDVEEHETLGRTGRRSRLQLHLRPLHRRQENQALLPFIHRDVYGLRLMFASLHGSSK